jgi:cytochrome o ubiquinol oxidase subunit 2
MGSILEPHGIIALSERGLMVEAVLFMLIVAVPVYALLFFFAWYYKAGNTEAKYVPNWEHSKMDELVWWAIPFEIVLIVGALTWTSSHALDPKKAIASDVPPVVVQVVALDWKWLFIYPGQNIATVNFLEIPIDTPIQFHITADAPMNSFWIPSLSGQIYAMTGMSNTLNIEADTMGDYKGYSANYSGEGFAAMKFTTRVVSKDDFDTWVTATEASSKILTEAEYIRLRGPSTEKPTYYREVTDNLYNTVVSSFLDPTNPAHHH